MNLILTYRHISVDGIEQEILESPQEVILVAQELYRLNEESFKDWVARGSVGTWKPTFYGYSIKLQAEELYCEKKGIPE